MEKYDESRTRRDEQRRKYSKVDKRANDKLVRSPRENGGEQEAQKHLHSRTGRDEKKGKTLEKMERGSRKRASSAGSEKMESWWQIEKNGRTLFDRPKPAVGCSANGRRRNDQLDAQLRHIIRLLLQSSTCFEQLCAHHQEVNLYWYSIWYSILCK